MAQQLDTNNINQIVEVVSHFIAIFADYKGEIMLFPYKEGVDVCRLTSRSASTIAYIPSGAKLEINETQGSRMQAKKHPGNLLLSFSFTWDDVKLTFDQVSITLSSTKYAEGQPGYFSIPIV